MTGDAVQRVRFGNVDTETKLFKPLQCAARVATAPGDDQIRLQGDDSFHVQHVVTTDNRQAGRLRREIAVVHNADNLLAGAQAE